MFKATFENKIPVLEKDEFDNIGDLKERFGSVHSLFIMPPNIETLRTKLEKSGEVTDATILNTL